MTDVDSQHVKVLFRVTNSDGSVDVETCWAIAHGQDRYELDNCPFYAYGVSYRDVVYAPHDEVEGFPTFQKVVSKSGNRTVRLVFETATDGPQSSILEGLTRLGCDFERATSRYVVVNLPPPVDLQAVVAFLVQRAVTWEYADPTYEEVHGS